MGWVKFKKEDRNTYPPTWTVFICHYRNGSKSVGWWDAENINSPGLEDGDQWHLWPTGKDANPTDHAKQVLYLLKGGAETSRKFPTLRAVQEDMTTARLLLRSVWRSLDLAGRSMGRSLDAVALETAMELIDRNFEIPFAQAQLYDENPVDFIESVRAALAAAPANNKPPKEA